MLNEDPVERFVAGRAWRSRQELYAAVKAGLVQKSRARRLKIA